MARAIQVSYVIKKTRTVLNDINDLNDLNGKPRGGLARVSAVFVEMA